MQEAGSLKSPLKKKLFLYFVHGTVTGPKIADKKPGAEYGTDELAFIFKLNDLEIAGQKYYTYQCVQYRDGAFITQNAEVLQPLRLLELNGMLAIHKAKEAQKLSGRLRKLDLGNTISDDLIVQDMRDTDQEDKVMRLDAALTWLNTSSILSCGDVNNFRDVLDAPDDLLALLQEVELLESKGLSALQHKLDELEQTYPELDDLAALQLEVSGLAALKQELTDLKGQALESSALEALELRTQALEAKKLIMQQYLELQTSLAVLSGLGALTPARKIRIGDMVWNVIREVVAQEAGLRVSELLLEQVARYTQDALFLQTLLQLTVVLNVDFQEIMLCLDGNLGLPAAGVLSPLFFMFVKALEPTRLIAFANTPVCVNLATQYCSDHSEDFVGIAGKTPELKQMVASIQEQPLPQARQLKRCDQTQSTSYLSADLSTTERGYIPLDTSSEKSFSNAIKEKAIDNVPVKQRRSLLKSLFCSSCLGGSQKVSKVNIDSGEDVGKPHVQRALR